MKELDAVTGSRDAATLFYTADAADFLIRQLPNDLDIRLCKSYRHFLELDENQVWGQHLISGVQRGN